MDHERDSLNKRFFCPSFRSLPLQAESEITEESWWLEARWITRTTPVDHERDSLNKEPLLLLVLFHSLLPDESEITEESWWLGARWITRTTPVDHERDSLNKETLLPLVLLRSLLPNESEITEEKGRQRNNIMADERAKILQHLFPRPPRHASLRYDTESLRYLIELDEDVGKSEREEVCAVCLDPIEDNCVASGYACKHTYHYDCLMDWVQQHNHDDCPQCRRLLWSPLEYQRIGLRLQQQHHHQQPEMPIQPGSPSPIAENTTSSAQDRIYEGLLCLCSFAIICSLFGVLVGLNIWLPEGSDNTGY